MWKEAQRARKSPVNLNVKSHLCSSSHVSPSGDVDVLVLRSVGLGVVVLDLDDISELSSKFFLHDLRLHEDKLLSLYGGADFGDSEVKPLDSFKDYYILKAEVRYLT